jgi:hypothetical protein
VLTVAAIASVNTEDRPAAVSAETRAELERLVRARTVAWFSGDNGGYAQFTTRHFLWNGNPARQRVRLEFDARPFDVTSFQVVEYPNVAIVSYVLTEYLNYENGAPFDRRRRTEFWVRDKSGWKAAAAESNEDCSSKSGRYLCF